MGKADDKLFAGQERDSGEIFVEPEKGCWQQDRDQAF